MTKKYYIAPYPIHRWAIYKTGDIRVSDVYTYKHEAERDLEVVIKRPNFIIPYMKKDAYRQTCYKIMGLNKQIEDLGYEWPEKWQHKQLEKILDSKTPKRLDAILKYIEDFIEENKDES